MRYYLLIFTFYSEILINTVHQQDWETEITSETIGLTFEDINKLQKILINQEPRVTDRIGYQRHRYIIQEESTEDILIKQVLKEIFEN